MSVWCVYCYNNLDQLPIACYYLIHEEIALIQNADI